MIIRVWRYSNEGILRVSISTYRKRETKQREDWRNGSCILSKLAEKYRCTLGKYGARLVQHCSIYEKKNEEIHYILSKISIASKITIVRGEPHCSPQEGRGFRGRGKTPTRRGRRTWRTLVAISLCSWRPFGLQVPCWSCLSAFWYFRDKGLQSSRRDSRTVIICHIQSE